MKNNLKEIKKMINDSEQAFGLLPGSLQQKTSSGLGRPRGTLNGVSLSEIRKAVCFRISEMHPELPLRSIGDFVGTKNHTSPRYSIRMAKHHIEKKDTDFLHCYNIVSSYLK